MAECGDVVKTLNGTGFYTAFLSGLASQLLNCTSHQAELNAQTAASSNPRTSSPKPEGWMQAHSRSPCCRVCLCDAPRVSAQFPWVPLSPCRLLDVHLPPMGYNDSDENL
jgi:hypothetical protein